jgi:hypothetical protein
MPERSVCSRLTIRSTRNDKRRDSALCFEGDWLGIGGASINRQRRGDITQSIREEWWIANGFTAKFVVTGGHGCTIAMTVSRGDSKRPLEVAIYLRPAVEERFVKARLEDRPPGITHKKGLYFDFLTFHLQSFSLLSGHGSVD